MTYLLPPIVNSCPLKLKFLTSFLEPLAFVLSEFLAYLLLEVLDYLLLEVLAYFLQEHLTYLRLELLA